MSRVTIALGSFIAGACSMLLFSGSQASLRAQEAKMTGRSTPIVATELVPLVPQLVATFSNEEIDAEQQQIDGLGFVHCTINSRVLTYGGGSFFFQDVKLPKSVRIDLVGAAANTVTFLSVIQGARIVAPPKQATPNAPIDKMASSEERLTFSLNSPYGLK